MLLGVVARDLFQRMHGGRIRTATALLPSWANTLASRSDVAALLLGLGAMLGPQLDAMRQIRPQR